MRNWDHFCRGREFAILEKGGGGGGESSGPGNKGGSGTSGLFKGPVVRDSKISGFYPRKAMMHFLVN